jgi:hypothetical protein
MSPRAIFTQTDPALLPVLEGLRPLEPIFHTPDFGTCLDDYARRMAPDYWEIGASGRRYSRDFILQSLEDDPPIYASTAGWRSSGFALRRLGPDVYLLTYTLVQGKRVTRRATHWQKTPEGWIILFHQGTVVTADEDDTAPPKS